MTICSNYTVIQVLWNPDTVDSSTFTKHDILLRNRITDGRLPAWSFAIAYRCQIFPKLYYISPAHAIHKAALRGRLSLNGIQKWIKSQKVIEKTWTFGN